MADPKTLKESAPSPPIAITTRQTGEGKPTRSTPAPDPELRALRQINNILATLDPQTAERVMRYCSERAKQRLLSQPPNLLTMLTSPNREVSVTGD